MDKMKPAAPFVFPTDEDRAAYAAIMKELEGNPKAIVTPGFLRLEQVLATANRIDFPVLVNDQGAQLVSEERLRQSDAFYVTRVAVHVRKDLSGNPVGSGQPSTWGNPLVFTGADLAPIATLMNTGRLRVEVDGVVYIQALDLLRFRQVDTAQQGLSNGTAAYGADAWKRIDTWAANVPVFRLNGGSNNQVSVLVNQTLALAAPVAGDSNVLAVQFHGWRAQNAGIFNAKNR